jgi:hypothetical protein
VDFAPCPIEGISWFARWRANGQPAEASPKEAGIR